MKNSRDLLTTVLKTAQMGQVGIRSVMDRSTRPDLRMAMESQLREYDRIESEAQSIAKNRQWALPELNPSVRFVSDRVSRMRLAFGDPDSKIAAMMIRGNTSGVIKGTRILNHMAEYDSDINKLTKKLLDTEASNVNQMKPFL